MLDGADVVVAVAIAQSDQVQRLLPVVAAGFLIGTDVGEKLDTALHGAREAGRDQPRKTGPVPRAIRPRLPADEGPSSIRC